MREALACRVALNAQKSLGCPGLSATRKLWQSRKVSVNVRGLPEARFGWGVRGAGEFCARSVNPFGRGRP
jgi:hypothetical protein